MKKLHFLTSILLVYCIVFTESLAGQSVSINTDGSAANANAMLDVKSTNKGILIPRIDYNNRPASAVPTGMLIYVIANGPLGNNAYYFYNGTKWLREKNSDDVQTLALNLDTLRITEGNYVVVGDILNLIGYYKCTTVYTQVATDPNNCGTCGHVCSAPNASSGCVGGTCTLTCNAGFGNCDNLPGNGCETNLANNVNNCGACGTICPTGANSTATCTSGNCGLICNAGFGNCDNNPGNGCEINLTNSINNCGSCGTVCPGGSNSTPTCTSGNCGLICNAGYSNCDNNPGNGCEVSVFNNVNNCGSCGNVCPFGANSFATCTSGNCGLICNAGFGNCDNNPSNGCEVNLSTNNNNCGSCGNVCPLGKSCSGGVCI